MPLSPLSDSVSLRLRDSYPLTSRHTATRRLILQKARRHGVASAPTACRSTVSGSLSLPSRGPFHLSLTVLCAIGSCRVSSLGGWSPLLPPGFHVSRRTQVRRPGWKNASHTGLSPSPAGLPSPFRSHPPLRPGLSPRRRPTTPPGSHRSVWAPPRSLAATWGISFDFLSCRYLAGSLPCVCPRVRYVFTCTVHVIPDVRVTPFGDPGILGCLLLPPAFRS